ncbi:cyclase family protein [Rhodococcus koreensis]
MERTDAPPGSSWGLFGAEDQLGMLNFLTPERIASAAALVTEGEVFNLDLRLDAFDPPISHRTVPKHTLFSNAEYHRDDILDNFFLQGSSQVDALRHMKHPKFGFYNGISDAEVDVGKPSLGIGLVAQRGIVGRGVLLDVDAYLRAAGRPLNHARSDRFTVEDLDGAARAQGVSLCDGDIVLVRTGYLSHVFGMDQDERQLLSKSVRSAGLHQSRESVAWLWDNRVALLACDNIAVEMLPAAQDSPFRDDPDLRDLTGLHVGMMHPVLLAMIGLSLGELWWLDDLARACHADQRWDFMLTCHPLHLVGGVGSPANAYAIR